MSTVPQLLPANQVEHFYGGGERIARFRSAGNPTKPAESAGERRPEEWLASMTTMTSSSERGLSALIDGRLLRDAIHTDPEGWLGPDHVGRFGASTELLVKLLDPGQRLPVHYHPDRAFSRQHLGLTHGKTEAWMILEADEGSRVRLGFAETMDLDQVRSMVDKRDSEALLASLRPLQVWPGDAILVPAGVPHSIDAGIFVLELQEPTDLSILLEAADLPVDLDRQGHLDLGYDTALRSLRVEALADEELSALVVRSADSLPVLAEPFFRAHRLTGSGSVEPGFAVVVVIEGAGLLIAESHAPLEVQRGDAALVPFAAGAWRLQGEVEAIVCRPPLPMVSGPA